MERGVELPNCVKVDDDFLMEVIVMGECVDAELKFCLPAGQAVLCISWRCAELRAGFLAEAQRRGVLFCFTKRQLQTAYKPERHKLRLAKLAPAGKTLIAENTAVPSMHLYPNPAKNEITIEYAGVDENSKLVISNVIGIIYEVRSFADKKGKLKLNTSSYSNGFYLAQVETGGRGQFKNKFVILK